ncbi:MAG TPA: AI-2E family transporter [Steroidobacteraceae bacterium]|nr:AI-2E family transporter [Steroidobacteraceae bacterium]
MIALAAMAGGAVLYFGHEVFAPVALALLFSIILSTAVEALHRRGLPRVVGGFLLLLALIATLGVVADALYEPAQQWLSSAPRTLQIIEKKVRPAEKLMHRLEELTTRAGALPSHEAAASPSAPNTPPAPATPSMSGTTVLSTTGSTVTSVVTTVILTLFLLAGGPPMLARMAAAGSSGLQPAHALRVIDAIRVELGHYYGTIALINVGLGVASGILLWALNVPNPWLWAVVAAVLNFIPYVGSATTLLLLAVVALVSFDDLSRVVGVVGGYLTLATLEGQVVQPLLVGRRLDLSPILVFLAVWFGGWFWGVAGIIIAVPTLAALKVAATHSERGQALVEFLSPTVSDSLQALKGKVAKARAPRATTCRGAKLDRSQRNVGVVLESNSRFRPGEGCGSSGGQHGV